MPGDSLISPFDDAPPPSDNDSFHKRLTLKQVDRDVYTGWCHAGAPLRAFGGQVAAQALVAAGATVDDPERGVHSLHAYFLRPGRTTDHIVYMVDRPKDGRNFTTRRVRAIQYGVNIFALSASFALPQPGPSHLRHGGAPPWWGDVPAPETLVPDRALNHVSLSEEDERRRAKALTELGYPVRQLFDLRVVEPAQAQKLSHGRFDRMVWVRSVQSLVETQLFNVCVLTYFSDLNLAGTVLGRHGGRHSPVRYELASLDHAMWFHDTFSASEWMLFATMSPASGSGRGFARGEFYRLDGALVASVAQEVLIRGPVEPR